MCLNHHNTFDNYYFFIWFYSDIRFSFFTSLLCCCLIMALFMEGPLSSISTIHVPHSHFYSWSMGEISSSQDPTWRHLMSGRIGYVVVALQITMGHSTTILLLLMLVWVLALPQIILLPFLLLNSQDTCRSYPWVLLPDLLEVLILKSSFQLWLMQLRN